MPAFSSSRVYQFPTVFAAHSGSETVCFFSFPIVWLKSSFHLFSLFFIDWQLKDQLILIIKICQF